MKEKPIIFSTPMVQALLNTKPNTWPAEPIDPSKPFKWMTRRVIKPRYRDNEAGFEVGIGLNNASVFIIDEDERTVRKETPKYCRGDILWVREAWHVTSMGSAGNMDMATIEYKAGGRQTIDITPDRVLYYAGKARWRPSIFMPREAARLFLEVKDVGVERVQNISERDALAEGFPYVKCLYSAHDCPNIWDFCTEAPYSSELCFSGYWQYLNEKRGYSWQSNPWVWVYEFGRVE
jgi:hypothetical protein